MAGIFNNDGKIAVNNFVFPGFSFGIDNVGTKFTDIADNISK